MRMTLMAITALLTVTLSTPALAGTAKPVQVQTKISKADLATQTGIQKTYARLQETAADSCGVQKQRTLMNRVVAERCEARLMNDFIDNVGHDGLSAYHRAQTRS